MAQNCSRDFERIVDYVDDMISEGDADKVAKLQKSFGLQELGHADDFAAYDLSQPQDKALRSLLR